VKDMGRVRWRDGEEGTGGGMKEGIKESIE
jgi:hypothetical protein